MKREPKRGATCAAKGCKSKPITIKGSSYAAGQWEDDPFCSTNCCRKYYGIVTKTLKGLDEGAQGNHPASHRGGYEVSFSIGRGRKGIGRP